jgi:GT2 family glycosyltransferase
MQKEPNFLSQTAVVIITHNSESCIKRLLVRLNDGGDRSIIVYWVDNGSSASSLAVYQKYLAEMALSFKVNKIWLGKNLGYAAAVNLAMSYVKEAYTLLVNPDVEVSGGWVSHIRTELEKNGAEIGSSTAILPNGSRDRNLARFPSLTNNLVGSAFAPRKIDQIFKFYLDFSCILMRTSFLRPNLPLRQFFLYGEDVDFMRRVRSQRPLVVYDSSVTYTHNRSTSSKQADGESKKVQRIVYAHALLSCEEKGFCYRLVFISTALIGSF